MSILLSAISSGSQTVLGELVGGVVMVLTLATALWLSRRRRQLLGVKPPQTTKLLRPSGYGLQQRLERLSDETDGTLLFFIGAGLIVGVCLVAGFPAVMRLVQGEAFPVGYYWTAPALFIGALLFQHAFRRLLKLTEKIRQCRLGLRGEQAVAEALAEQTLVATGYVTFHDVPGDGDWNIDHVVVGPAGVFVIETKVRSRRKATRDQEEHWVFFDGRTLQFPWCYDPDAASQATRNAKWVRDFIADFAPKDIVVQPVVVVPGWYVKSLGNYPVKAMNAEYLKKDYLPTAKRRFTPEQLRLIVRRLDEHCRNVEF